MELLSTIFKVLNWSIPLFFILIFFIVIGLITIAIFFFALFSKKNTNISYEDESVSKEEFKRLEKFDELRNDLEQEIGKVKKIMKSKK